jgi:hypothetical protein
MAYLKFRSLAYEEEISKNVPSPNTNADFDTSLHMTKSTRETQQAKSEKME